MATKKITALRLVLGIWALSAIAAFLALNQSISPWFTVPFVLPMIIVVPGFLVLMALRLHTNTSVDYVLYAIGMSLAFWILGGLILNDTLPLLGVTAPLSIVPLTALFVSAIVLFGIAAIIRQPNRHVTIALCRPRSLLVMVVIPILLVVMSVMGANTLNNGGSGAVTLVMLFCIAAYTMAVVSLRRHFNAWGYVFAIFTLSLALLFMYSLRSWHILGWDIHGEFQVFQATLLHHRWKMSNFPHQPYNACLSITILPTILQEFTHLSSEYVFKVAYQILFAISPVAIYAVAQRYVHQFLAFLASIIFASQTWFYEQMPALIRQEIAFIIFAVILLVIFDRGVEKVHRSILFFVFTAALILSHYSTSYVFIILLLSGSLLSIVARLTWPRLKGQPSAFGLDKVVLSLLMLFLWQGAVTHTFGAATAFATESASHLKEAFSPIVIKNGFVLALSGSANQSTNQNLEAVYALALRRSQNYANDLYPSSTYRGYVARVQDDRRYLSSRLPHSVSASVRILAVAARATLIGVFTLLGTFVIFMRVRKKTPLADLDYGILILISCALVIAFLFVPYFQEQYNLSRLYLQAMVVLSVSAVVGLWSVFRHLPKARYFAASGLVAFCMLFMTGALDHIIGGQMRIVTVQQNGTIDRFYTYDQEVASAKWLSRFRDRSEPVYADCIASLRLLAYANLNANRDLFPATIGRKSYVYLDAANVKGGDAFYHYYNTTIVSSVPLAFLNAQKDIVYSNGDSIIYR